MDDRPNIAVLTAEERDLVNAAVEAVAIKRSSFEHWLTIGHALKALRAKAERLKGRKVFQQLREQNRLRNEVVTDAQATNILRVLQRLPEVVAWRLGLTEKQRYQWAAPNTILKHCPVFRTDAAPREPKPTLRDSVIELQKENDRLKHQVTEFETRQGDDRAAIDPKRDTAADIAKVLVRLMSETKFEMMVKAAREHYRAKCAVH